MKITKTWFKTEIDFTVEEVEQFKVRYRLGSFTQEKFFKMLERLFNEIGK